MEVAQSKVHPLTTRTKGSKKTRTNISLYTESGIANSLNSVNYKYLTQKLFDGYKRKSKSKDIRLPITAQILENILKVMPILCNNNF